MQCSPLHWNKISRQIICFFDVKMNGYGKNACCVHGCNNSQRKPEELVIKSHVKHMRLHRIPRASTQKNEEKRKQWVLMIAKGRPGFNPGNETFVCSNHFVDGEPTPGHPYPTLGLKSPSSVERKPPK
jgi:hypothetical protein